MIEGLSIFVNSGCVAPIYSYFFFSLIVMVVFRPLLTQKLSFTVINNKQIWMLGLMGLLFALNYPSQSDYNIIVCMVLYLINPILVFGSGFLLATLPETNEDSTERIYRLFMSIAVGCAIHVILNIFANINRDRWHTVDFFSPDQMMAATNLGTVNTYIFSLVPVLAIITEKKKKIFGILLFVLSMIYAFILGTRSQFIVIVAVIIVALLAYFIYYHSGKISRQRLLLIVTAIVMVPLIAYIMYSQNTFGIKTFIDKSNLLYRFIDPDTSGSDSYRLNLLKKGLLGLITNPLGGRVSGTTYYHNYWLDIGRVSGIIPFILAVVYNILIVKHTFDIFGDKNVSALLRYSFLCLTVGFLINFFTEPILDGYLDFFYRFCLINGITEGYYYRIHNLNYEISSIRRIKIRVSNFS